MTTQEDARAEALRAVLGYVHPNAARTSAELLIQQDPIPLAFVEGFEAGAQWAQNRAEEFIARALKAAGVTTHKPEAE